MTTSILPSFVRTYRPGPVVQLLVMLAAAFVLALAISGFEPLDAQIEGERGIPPIASSKDIHVTGIEVDATGKSGAEARAEGWQMAQRKAWAKLKGPKMDDGQLDAMVIAIVIEREQIGPRRYVAQLGVIFDRSKAASYVGSAAGGGLARAHSAPMLVIPVLYSGGVRQVFEVQGPWQRAWASFQTGASPIEYVRPTGAGGDSLVLNAGQTGRRSRIWWRTLLNQFDAADVLIPVARLERQWPGGPVKGIFTARYGPDNTFIESFEMSADAEEKLPLMLAQAVQRMDRIFGRALADGLLTPDPTLMAEERAFDAALAQLRQKLAPKTQVVTSEPTERTTSSETPTATPTTAAAVSSFTVQFASPDAAAVDAALAAVRGASGVRGAATTSLAIGGTSVMRVTYAGDLTALAGALRARGWNVVVGSNALSISR